MREEVQYTGQNQVCGMGRRGSRIFSGGGRNFFLKIENSVNLFFKSTKLNF